MSAPSPPASAAIRTGGAASKLRMPSVRWQQNTNSNPNTSSASSSPMAGASPRNLTVPSPTSGSSGWVQPAWKSPNHNPPIIPYKSPWQRCQENAHGMDLAMEGHASSGKIDLLFTHQFGLLNSSLTALSSGQPANLLTPSHTTFVIESLTKHWPNVQQRMRAPFFTSLCWLITRGVKQDEEIRCAALRALTQLTQQAHLDSHIEELTDLLLQRLAIDTSQTEYADQHALWGALFTRNLATVFEHLLDRVYATSDQLAESATIELAEDHAALLDHLFSQIGDRASAISSAGLTHGLADQLVQMLGDRDRLPLTHKHFLAAFAELVRLHQASEKEEIIPEEGEEIETPEQREARWTEDLNLILSRRGGLESDFDPNNNESIQLYISCLCVADRYSSRSVSLAPFAEYYRRGILPRLSEMDGVLRRELLKVVARMMPEIAAPTATSTAPATPTNGQAAIHKTQPSMGQVSSVLQLIESLRIQVEQKLAERSQSRTSSVDFDPTVFSSFTSPQTSQPNSTLASRTGSQIHSMAPSPNRSLSPVQSHTPAAATPAAAMHINNNTNPTNSVSSSPTGFRTPTTRLTLSVPHADDAPIAAVTLPSPAPSPSSASASASAALHPLTNPTPVRPKQITSPPASPANSTSPDALLADASDTIVAALRAEVARLTLDNSELSSLLDRAMLNRSHTPLTPGTPGSDAGGVSHSYDDLVDRLARTKRELAEAVLEIRLKDAHLQRFEPELRLVREGRDQAEATITNMESELAAAREKAAEVDTIVAEARRESEEAHQAEIEAIKRQHATQITDAQSKTIGVEELIQQVRGELTTAHTAELEQLRSAHAAALADADAQRQSALDDMLVQHDEEMTALETDLDFVRSENELLRRANESSAKSVTLSETSVVEEERIQELEAIIEDLKLQQEEAATVAHQRITQLQEKLAAAIDAHPPSTGEGDSSSAADTAVRVALLASESRNLSLQSQLDQSEARASSLQLRSDSSEGHAASLQLQLQSSQAQVASLKLQIQASQNRIDAMEGRQEADQAEQQSSGSSTIDGTDSSSSAGSSLLVSTLTDQLRDSRDLISQLSREAEEQRDLLAQAAEQIDQLAAEIETNREQQLRRDEDGAPSDNNTGGARTTQTSQSVQAETNKIVALEEELNQLRIELANVTSHAVPRADEVAASNEPSASVTDLTAEVEQLHLRISELENDALEQRTQSEEATDAMDVERRAHADQLAEAETQLAALRTQLSNDAEERASEHALEVDRLRTRVKELEEELSVVRAELDQANQTIDDRAAQLARMEEQAASTTELASASEQKILDLGVEIDQLRAQVASLETECVSLRAHSAPAPVDGGADSIAAALATRTPELDACQNELTAIRQRVADDANIIQQLRASIDNAQAELAANTTTPTDTISLDDARFTELQARHDQLIADLKAAHALELSQLRNLHAAEKSSLDSMFVSSAEAHVLKLSQLEESRVLELQHLGEMHLVQLDQERSRVRELEDHIAMLADRPKRAPAVDITELRALQKRFVEFQATHTAQHEEANERIAALEALLTISQNEATQLKEARDTRDQRHALELHTLAKAHQIALAKAVAVNAPPASTPPPALVAAAPAPAPAASPSPSHAATDELHRRLADSSARVTELEGLLADARTQIEQLQAQHTNTLAERTNTDEAATAESESTSAVSDPNSDLSSVTSVALPPDASSAALIAALESSIARLKREHAIADSAAASAISDLQEQLEQQQEVNVQLYDRLEAAEAANNKQVEGQQEMVEEGTEEEGEGEGEASVASEEDENGQNEMESSTTKDYTPAVDENAQSAAAVPASQTAASDADGTSVSDDSPVDLSSTSDSLIAPSIDVASPPSSSVSPPEPASPLPLADAARLESELVLVHARVTALEHELARSERDLADAIALNTAQKEENEENMQRLKEEAIRMQNESAETDPAGRVGQPLDNASRHLEGQYQAEVERLQEELIRIETHHQQKVLALQEEIAHTHASHAERLQELQVDLANRDAQHQQQLQSMRDDMARAAADHAAEVHALHERMSNDSVRHFDELRLAKSEFDVAAGEHRSEVERIEKELTSARHTIDTFESAEDRAATKREELISTLYTDIESLRSQLSASESRVTEVSELADRELDQFRQLLTKQQTDLDQLLSLKTREHDFVVNELRQQLSDQVTREDTEHSNFELRLQALQDQLFTKEDDVRELMQTIFNLRQELAAHADNEAQHDLHLKQVAALTEEVIQMKEQVIAQEAKLSAAIVQRQEAIAAHAGCRAEHEAQLAQIASLTLELDTHNSDPSSRSRAPPSVDHGARIRALTSDIDHLNHLVATHQSTIDTLNQEKADLTRARDAAVRAQAESDARRETLASQVEQLTHDLTTVKQHGATSQAALQDELSSSRAEIDRLRSLKVELSQVRSQLTQLQSTHNELQSSIAESIKSTLEHAQATAIEEREREKEDAKETIRALTQAHEELKQRIKMSESTAEEYRRAHAALYESNRVLSDDLSSARRNLSSSRVGYVTILRSILFELSELQSASDRTKSDVLLMRSTVEADVAKAKPVTAQQVEEIVQMMTQQYQQQIITLQTQFQLEQSKQIEQFNSANMEVMTLRKQLGIKVDATPTSPHGLRVPPLSPLSPTSAAASAALASPLNSPTGAKGPNSGASEVDRLSHMNLKLKTALQNLLTRSDDKIAKLTADLKQKTVQVAAYKSDHARHVEQMTLLRTKYAAIKRQVAKTPAATNREKAAQLAAVKEESNSGGEEAHTAMTPATTITTLQGQIQQLEDHMKQLEKEHKILLETKERDVTSIQSQLDSTRIELSSQLGALELSRTQLTTLQGQLQSESALVTSLRNQLAQAKHSADLAVAHASATLVSEKKTLESTLERERQEAADTNRQLQEELSHTNQVRHSLEEDFSTLTHSFEQYRSESEHNFHTCETLFQQHLQKLIETHSNELRNSKVGFDLLQKQYDTLLTSHELLSNEHIILKDMKEKLQHELTEVRKNVVNLNTSIESNRELQKSKEDEFLKLEKDLHEQQQLLKIKQNEISMLKSSNSTIKQQYEEVQTKLTQLTNEKSQFEQTLRVLKDELTDSHKQVSSLRTDLTQSRQHVSQLELQRTTELEGSRTSQASQQQLIENLRHELDGHNRNIQAEIQLRKDVEKRCEEVEKKMEVAMREKDRNIQELESKLRRATATTPTRLNHTAPTVGDNNGGATPQATPSKIQPATTTSLTTPHKLMNGYTYPPAGSIVSPSVSAFSPLPSPSPLRSHPSAALLAASDAVARFFPGPPSAALPQAQSTPIRLSANSILTEWTPPIVKPYERGTNLTKSLAHIHTPIQVQSTPSPTTITTTQTPHAPTITSPPSKLAPQ